MQILAIDYGKKKIGLAVSAGELAEPYKVLRVSSWHNAFEKIHKVVKKENIEKIVIGISEGKMAKETKKFAGKLKEKLNIEIVYEDETMTTQEAQSRAIEAGIKRRKRKRMEDAYAATLILQEYLDRK